jgi:hypothetical protein
VIGIDLDTVAPTIEVTSSPKKIWRPNNKPRTVTITVKAAPRQTVAGRIAGSS